MINIQDKILIIIDIYIIVGIYSMINVIVLIMYYVAILQAISADNICTFHIKGSLFSLVYLQKQSPYRLDYNQYNKDQQIIFNFCAPFQPIQCPNSESAYSFLVTKTIEQIPNHQEQISKNQSASQDNSEIQSSNQININQSSSSNQLNNKDQLLKQSVLQSFEDVENTIKYQCSPYSSNSYSYYFHKSYKNGALLLTLDQTNNNRKTQFYIHCTNNYELQIRQTYIDGQTLRINGASKYGCPVFQVSNIWNVFHDNWILIGIILLIVGLYLLFYGRQTLVVTVFVTAFFIMFGILGALATVLVSPYSSTFIVYFSFILIVFLSTLIAYLVTKIINLSIFFVGAFLGLIIGVLMNSIFVSIFEVYSIWSLVIFIIIFAIPFGFLTFKYSDHIVIASTSLTGAYLVVRPISWIFGGFPNQFLLYHLIQTNQLQRLPWSFYLYLTFIIALAVIGAMYQLLKLQRDQCQERGSQVSVNFIQGAIEQPFDRIKMAVDGIIDRYKSSQKAQSSADPQQLKQKGKYYKLDDIKQDSENNRKRSDSNEWVRKQNYSPWKDEIQK